MVHNGIEYADMQLIAETYDILKSVYGLPARDIGDVFADWKSSALDSYLIEIASAVLRKTDGTGAPLVDQIVDEAEQKGTGRWTAQSALELGVPITAITEAVYARALSSRRDLRSAAERRFPHAQLAPRKADPAEIGAIRDALYASKIVAYAQGFEQMSKAARSTVGASISARLRRFGAAAASSAHECSIGSWRPISGNPLSPTCCSRTIFATPSSPRRPHGARSSRPRSQAAFQPRLFHRGWPITTGSGAPGGPPTCCRACATISARTPIAGSTGPASFTRAGPRTAQRSAPTDGPHSPASLGGGPVHLAPPQAAP